MMYYLSKIFLCIFKKLKASDSYMYRKKFRMIILIIYFKNIEIGDNYSK